MPTPYDNLRRQLRERGCSVETFEVLPTATKAHTFIGLLIYRKDKHPIRAVVIDSEEDGYSLFLPHDCLEIAKDIEAIETHDSGAESRELIAQIARMTLTGDAGGADLGNDEAMNGLIRRARAISGEHALPPSARASD